MMDDLAKFGLELGQVKKRAASRVRGALGKGADEISDTARAMARSKGWSEETADGIYARMAIDQENPTAYVFAKGPAAYQETGTSRHPPNPTLGPAMDQHADSIAESVADAIGGIL